MQLVADVSPTFAVYVPLGHALQPRMSVSVVSVCQRGGGTEGDGERDGRREEGCGDERR